MADCSNKQTNLKNCTCSYGSCSRKGRCCECVMYHKKNGEIPGCFFSSKDEQTYDRSIENFISTHKK
ncbi:MAG: hypothetical protein A2252_01640 [Elusimicrobia bacterium RIFOXYA2_FULL_39_19]|nr:MAG: hypothetical protein A2252_01640 [Elusimicrobia bacterium RIFOXYA2_FULL_39_19]